MSQATLIGQSSAPDDRDQLASVLQKYWGYDQFRPQQLDAMQAVMSDRDSVVVFPTGGGKSLCFQAPRSSRCSQGLRHPSRILEQFTFGGR